MPSVPPHPARAPREPPAWRAARWALALGLAAAAAHHARLALAGGAGAGRHGVFVAIDALAALATALPAPIGALGLLALTAQQLASHGPDLYASFAPGASLDLASLASLLAVPTATLLVVRRVRALRKAA